MNHYKAPFTLALLLCALAAMGATSSSSPYLDEALATQEALAATEPHNPEVLNDLGNLLALAGENERAEDAYRRALEIDPGNAKTRYNMALMLQEEGLRKQAIAEFRQVIELAPNDAWAHYQLGRCYEEARKRSLAIEEYARAFDLDSSLASPRVNPHIIENSLATEALLVAYSTDETAAGQAPRMYEEPARIAEILTPPVPTPEEEPEEEAVQADTGSVRRVTVQSQVDDGSREGSDTTETPATLGSQSSAPATATGAATPTASDADIAASRRAMIQRRLAAQAAVQQASGGESPQVTSPPPTAISQEETQAPEEREPETQAPAQEPAEDDPPEQEEPEQEEYEPAPPSTGQGGTRVIPAPFQPGAPSTGRLELELIPIQQDRLGAG